MLRGLLLGPGFGFTQAIISQVLLGSRILSTAEKTGMVVAMDIRMLGGAAASASTPRGADSNPRALLWQSRDEDSDLTCRDAGMRLAAGASASLCGLCPAACRCARAGVGMCR